MPHNDNSDYAAVGVDVGTSRICLAQRLGETFHYETQLNAFITIPFSNITKDVLEKENVPHKVTGSEIIVHGNESGRFADLLNVETRRAMDKGVLNPVEPARTLWSRWWIQSRNLRSCTSRFPPRRSAPRITLLITKRHCVRSSASWAIR
jgi:hypothetical protein